MTLEASTSRTVTAAEAAVDASAIAVPPRSRWRGIYPSTLALLDVTAFLVSGLLATQIRFHGDLVPVGRMGVVALVTPVVWAGLLAAGGGYRLGRIGLGADEYKTVFNAVLRLAALLCFAAFV